MKKLLVLMLTVVLLAACGSENTPEEGTSEETANETEKEEVVAEKDDDTYFDGKTLQLEDIKIEITETKVISAGEGRNESDVPIFAIWYEMTNLSDEDYNTSDWMIVFDAIQDNDPNVESTLSTGILPDENHTDSQFDKIKKGGTVEGSISYKLEDEVTPVTLIASRGVWEEVGRHTYELE